ncbi:glutamate mutase L [uncultured Desulfobulbus sp.]|uniref:glutamate mutase L n=1 Tax=uncultured Desulfobulbus sp. TaxID=239745 RepID=UPI0029C7C59C|nr:glutamate mutase L [uncultured Desulfobulbus sp.]
MTDIKTILATDCGSTTTKAILIEKQGDEYRLIVRGEAPTTVEAPFDDVTVGVLNAVREVDELSGRRILVDGKILVPSNGGEGVDLYLSTSSAGGGLQMTVAGVVKSMSAESAERAALGAGAIIIDVIAVDDGRKEYEKVQRIRELRPDMILMSGGTDGGTTTHLVEIAEMLLSADPRPRLGIGMKLPVIYAGNKDAVGAVSDIVEKIVDLKVVDNLRPAIDRENLFPAREAIHELFLQHVMQQAPGYGKLMTWTSAGIMSTPNAVGKIIQAIAEQDQINVLAVDIGGATTDVFSVFDGVFTRTVSANLGMSYSICNVLAESGIANIRRWIPFQTDEGYVRNELRNKMIRPTTIPQTLRDLYIEQAVSREALRLAFDHHKSLARELKGVQQSRTIGDALSQESTGKTLVKMVDLDMIVGSGGVLSHAPLRQQAAMMMLDAYQPEGVTMLAVDSIFMMPQLGILSTIMPEAASQVFNRDCLIKLGTSIAPMGVGKEGQPACQIEINGETISIPFGSIRVIPLKAGEKAEMLITPSKGFDVGAGKGHPHTVEVEGGEVGVVIDARGRPLQIPSDDSQRLAKLKEWFAAFGLAEVK